MYNWCSPTASKCRHAYCDLRLPCSCCGGVQVCFSPRVSHHSLPSLCWVDSTQQPPSPRRASCAFTRSPARGVCAGVCAACALVWLSRLRRQRSGTWINAAASACCARAPIRRQPMKAATATREPGSRGVVLAVLATLLVTSQQVLGVVAVAAAHLVGRRLHGLPTTYVLVATPVRCSSVAVECVTQRNHWPPLLRSTGVGRTS
jgi:hypothetical protein